MTQQLSGQWTQLDAEATLGILFKSQSLARHALPTLRDGFSQRKIDGFRVPDVPVRERRY